MKIIRKAVLDILKLTTPGASIADATEFEDSYQHLGAVAEAQTAPGQTFNPRINGTDAFFYSHPPVSTLSSVAPTASAVINLDADSSFYCVAMTYTASIADAILTESTFVLPLVRVLITDTGSGKALMNAPIAMPAFMGDGKRPYRMVRPRVFPANATIQFAFTAFVAAGTTYSDLQITLHGFKVYT